MILLDPMVPVIGGSLKWQRRFGKIGLIGPEPSTVRVIGGRRPKIAVGAHRAVAVVAKMWTARGIYGNKVGIHAETMAVCVTIGEQASLKHLVWRKTNAWYNAGRREG